MPIMHGPAFDGSGEIVERDIPEADVPAYTVAGYVPGKMDIKTVEEVVEEVAEKPKKAAKKK